MEAAAYFERIDNDSCSSVGLAAREGNLLALQEILDSDCSSHAISDNRGWFPVHEAASNGHSRCMECLLMCENNHIDDQTYEGETPLYLAAREGHLDAISVLLDKGADISICNNEEVSILIAAVKNGDLECIELLLDHGVDVNAEDVGGWSALHEAAYAGHSMCISTLLSCGALVDAQNSDGATAIFTAAQYGHQDCIELLIEKGANIDLITVDGATPLFIAAQEGYLACVQMLLTAGADPSQVTDDGASALHAAGERGHVSCMTALLDAGVNPEATTSIGIMVLHLAAQEGHSACVESLLSRGVVVDAALPGHKMTPLCLAARGHAECCRLLLNAGAYPDHEYEDVDLLPKTPLMTAVEGDYHDCARVLLEHGADTNKATYTSPLIMVTQFSSRECLELLLEHGADINYVDRGRNSALSLAVTRLGYSMSSREPVRQIECIKLLLKAGSNVGLLFSESPCMAFRDPLAPISTEVFKLLLEFEANRPEIRKICRNHESKIKWHELIRLTGSPRSLQHLTRLVIRQNLGYKRLKRIEDLPLPFSLKRFLQYFYL